MGPRILDVAMTDQEYEALRKKLLETYSVRPTLLNPTVKRLVDWHCLKSSCFLDNKVFDKREKWMRHHQRFHNRMCESDRGYPKEVEARQFIQEHELRENARLGIAAPGGSAGLMSPAATPAGPYSRISGAMRAIPLNSAAPSSSASGALCGASPNSAAPNSPRSGALRNSVAAGRRSPYRLCVNQAARRQEYPDGSFVNTAGALQDEPESSGTLDAAQREILMQQLSYNLQAVSQINTDSARIMQILAGSKRPRESPNTVAQEYPSTTVATAVPLPTWVDRRARASTSWRARGLQAGQSKFVDAASPAPAHCKEGPAQVSEAIPYTSQAPAHSNEEPVYVFEATPYPSQTLAYSNKGPAHPNQALALALSVGGPAHSYEGPPLSVERPAHPYESPPLSIEGPVHLALTYMTPSQREEREEENYNAASDSEKVDSDNEDQADDVSQDVYEGQLQWRDVKIEVVEP